MLGLRHHAGSCYLAGCTQAEPWPAQAPAPRAATYIVCMYIGEKVPLRANCAHSDSFPTLLLKKQAGSCLSFAFSFCFSLFLSLSPTPFPLSQQNSSLTLCLHGVFVSHLPRGLWLSPAKVCSSSPESLHHHTSDDSESVLCAHLQIRISYSLPPHFIHHSTGRHHQSGSKTSLSNTR